MPAIPQVAVLVDTSRSYGRDIVRGIRRYAAEHGPWSLYLEPRDLRSSFPDWLQPAIQALPLTALNDGLRAVMIDGAGLAGIAGELAINAAWCVAAFAAALALFRWR